MIWAWYIDVERGDRLIRNDEPGLDDETARDANALALTPRELVGITIQYFAPAQANFRQCLLGLKPDLSRAVCKAVEFESFGYRLADRHAGVERCIGVLKNHLHASPYGLQLSCVQLCDILALEGDLA